LPEVVLVATPVAVVTPGPLVALVVLPVVTLDGGVVVELLAPTVAPLPPAPRTQSGPSQSVALVP
jgi:hypothetical protein